VSLKNRRQQNGEYLEAVYWGSVNTSGVEEFVEENARIVKCEINLKITVMINGLYAQM